jgi:phosphoglycerate-specific signal transduction histidine kinase
MESFLMKARLLTRAELVLFRLHIRRAARQATFIAMGVVAILLAVGMANVASYFYLSDQLGRITAGFVLTVMNGLLAAVMFLVASRLGLGPEAKMAGEIRDLAVAQLSAETQRIKDDVDTVRSDVAEMRSAISSLRRGEFLSLAVLAPIVKMVSRALQTKQPSS